MGTWLSPESEEVFVSFRSPGEFACQQHLSSTTLIFFIPTLFSLYSIPTNRTQRSSAGHQTRLCLLKQKRRESQSLPGSSGSKLLYRVVSPLWLFSCHWTEDRSPIVTLCFRSGLSLPPSHIITPYLPGVLLGEQASAQLYEGEKREREMMRKAMRWEPHIITTTSVYLKTEVRVRVRVTLCDFCYDGQMSLSHVVKVWDESSSSWLVMTTRRRREWEKKRSCGSIRPDPFVSKRRRDEMRWEKTWAGDEMWCDVRS